LQAAKARRAPLLEDAATTALRLCHGEADGLPDVTVDLFDTVAVLSLYRAFDADDERRLADAVAQTSGARAVYLKRRPKEARVVANVARAEVAPPLPLWGEPTDALWAKENGLGFLIRPGQGLPVGLYLDMRDARAWLRQRVAGAQVLNTFAFTCAFGVHAHAGGARRVVNVDLSRRVLDWGEENLRHNGFSPERRDHLSGDCFDWLARLARKEERFDVVVLDPPSFSTSGRGRFSAGRDYPRLVEAATRVVAKDGLLLAACNLEALRPGSFARLCEQGVAAAGRRVRQAQALSAPDVDFPLLPGQVPPLKVRALRL
jgi:23S rRNA (cytosine1962-C5)-methyltransferase